MSALLTLEPFKGSTFYVEETRHGFMLKKEGDEFPLLSVQNDGGYTIAITKIPGKPLELAYISSCHVTDIDDEVIEFEEFVTVKEYSRMTVFQWAKENPDEFPAENFYMIDQRYSGLGNTLRKEIEAGYGGKYILYPALLLRRRKLEEVEDIDDIFEFYDAGLILTHLWLGEEQRVLMLKFTLNKEQSTEDLKVYDSIEVRPTGWLRPTI